MSTKKTVQEATQKQKTQVRQTIARKIDLALEEFKNEQNRKKYEKGLRKASKLLSKIVAVPVAKKVNGKKSPTKTTSFAE